MSVNFADFLSVSQSRIRTYLDDAVETDAASLQDLLQSCCSLLYAFVVSNFTGQELSVEIASFAKSLPSEAVDSSCLEFDNLRPSKYCLHLALLTAAKRLAEKASEKYPESFEGQIVLFRVLHVLQLTFSEKSPSLKRRIFAIMRRVHGAVETLQATNSDYFKTFLAGVLLEWVRVCLYYHETVQAEALLRRVREALEVNLQFSGVLGKRTRFQHEAIAQLIVLTTKQAEKNDNETAKEEEAIGSTLESRIDVIVDSEERRSAAETRVSLRRMLQDDAEMRAIFADYGSDAERHTAGDSLPSAVLLNDDTLLPKVHYEKSAAEDCETLRCIEQALLLAHCDVERRSQAHEDLVVRAQAGAVIELLVGQPRCFAAHFEALLIRSRLDAAGTSRTFERSFMQYEHLATHTQPFKEDAARLHSFFWVNVAPRWRVEFEYGALLMRLGMFQNALEVYTRLESWSDMLSCYRSLGRLNAAQELLRERISAVEQDLKAAEAQADESGRPEKQIETLKSKLADLYCALGEVTCNVEYLQQAWVISGERHAACQSVLGFVELANQRIDEALAAFERSLKVRPLHFGTQFACGCLALQRGRYTDAIRAFRMCVSLDPEDARAWSNLAAALVRCGEKRKALALLDEAVRCQYEDWRIWENYMLVAADCGAMPDAVRAIHRLADLRKEDRALDRDLFVSLVDSALSDGEKPEVLKKFRKQLRELFARLSSTRAIRAWFFWLSYARLVAECESAPNDLVSLDRAVEHVQRALRALLSNEILRRTEMNESAKQASSPWERDAQRRGYVVIVCRALVQRLEAYASAAAASEESLKLTASEKLDSHRNAIRLAISNVTAIVRKYKESLITPKTGELEELDEFLSATAELLQSI